MPTHTKTTTTSTSEKIEITAVEIRDMLLLRYCRPGDGARLEWDCSDDFHGATIELRGTHDVKHEDIPIASRVAAS